MKGPTLPSNEILEQHISNTDELSVTHVSDTMSLLGQGLMEMLKGKTKSLVGKSVKEYRRVKAGLLKDCGAMTDLSNEGVNGMDELVREEVTKKLEVEFSKKIGFLENSASELGSEVERLQDQLRENGSKLEDEEKSTVILNKEVVGLKETLERKDREILDMLSKQNWESDKSSDKIASLKVEIDRMNAIASGLKAQENDPKYQANRDTKSLLTGSCLNAVSEMHKNTLKQVSLFETDCNEKLKLNVLSQYKILELEGHVNILEQELKSYQYFDIRKHLDDFRYKKIDCIDRSLWNSVSAPIKVSFSQRFSQLMSEHRKNLSSIGLKFNKDGNVDGFQNLATNIPDF
jgi:hypothetical protein